jgi:hypothetical protein
MRGNPQPARVQLIWSDPVPFHALTAFVIAAQSFPFGIMNRHVPLLLSAHNSPSRRFSLESSLLQRSLIAHIEGFHDSIGVRYATYPLAISIKVEYFHINL